MYTSLAEAGGDADSKSLQMRGENKMLETSEDSAGECRIHNDLNKGLTRGHWFLLLKMEGPSREGPKLY